jgi:NADH:ubiquinone oxidoreductase subunit 4 (subunit M)
LTSGFIGELLIFIGIFEINIFLALLSSFGIIFGTIYSI